MSKTFRKFLNEEKKPLDDYFIEFRKIASEYQAGNLDKENIKWKLGILNRKYNMEQVDFKPSQKREKQ